MLHAWDRLNILTNQNRTPRWTSKFCFHLPPLPLYESLKGEGGGGGHQVAVKRAKNLAVRGKNWNILTVSHKNC